MGSNTNIDLDELKQVLTKRVLEWSRDASPSRVFDDDSLEEEFRAVEDDYEVQWLQDRREDVLQHG